ncbi:MAG: LLM class flavin-dependent oxidoreductase [Acidimicrobiia bacterium]|nr:LLM class flavin-dependent oxidoreductase [Acidimicrobiia bacterium]
MIISTIRFNFALPGLDPAENARRHRAAVTIAQAADRAGLQNVSLEEHHGVHHDGQPLGWCASPFTIAAAVLAVTERVTVGLWGIALPLHDPVRVAEDVATLDLLGPGRVVLVVNAGYRAAEFDAHGVDFDDRDQLFDTKLAALLAAWSDGSTTTPVPATRPHPMVLVGGASVADARRAAAHQLAFRPSADRAELRTAYDAACEAHGHHPLYLPPPADVHIVQVADDPDEWWQAVGPHLLLEAQVYASWLTDDDHSAVHSRAATVDELRAEGRYQVLTPGQAVELAHRSGSILFHPLCGGTPLDRAEQSAALFIDDVLPRLDRQTG